MPLQYAFLSGPILGGRNSENGLPERARANPAKIRLSAATTFRLALGIVPRHHRNGPCHSSCVPPASFGSNQSASPPPRCGWPVVRPGGRAVSMCAPGKSSSTTTTSSRPPEPSTGASSSCDLLAVDVGRLSRLLWVAETSMLKSLTAKQPVHRVEDGSPLPGHDLHTACETHVLPGRHRMHRQAAAGHAGSEGYPSHKARLRS